MSAVHKLTPGKSDCTCIDNMSSDNLPIPQNKRGNKCNSNNYRQIAICSILEKYLIYCFGCTI